MIYFGDHLAADLADVTLHHGWKTAAVIRSDLHKFVHIQNDVCFDSTKQMQRVGD